MPNDFTSSNVIQKGTSGYRVDQGLLTYNEFSPMIIMPREYPHKLYINVRPVTYHDMTKGTRYADEEITAAQVSSRGLSLPTQSFYIVPNTLPETGTSSGWKTNFTSANYCLAGSASSASVPPTASGPSMVLVGTDTYNLGGANMDSVLTDARSFFTYENLNWATLCANADIRPTLTVNGYKDYTRQLKAGLEVYPVDIPASATYEGNFQAVGLSTSSNVPSHGFISDTPCPRTSANVYKFGANSGIGGSLGSISNTNYTGSAPGSVKVKPGRWYVTILWGSGSAPAPDSPNYGAYLNNTARLDVRFQHWLTATNPTVPTFTNPRTINNSSCSINISGAQYGTVNTTLVYKNFPPNASGGYYLGSSSAVIPVSTVLAGLSNCPSGTSEGSLSGKAGNRSTFSALNVECKVGSDVYKLDYPDSCSTLCSSANPNAFIDVRGDCVINGGGSF
jgi:hypothetical protein